MSRPNQRSERLPAATSRKHRAARERRRDLALLAARGEPRAEVGVDLLDLVGLGRGVGLAAREARDLLQRLGVRRHLHLLQEAERVAQLDLAARACRARSRRSGSCARPASRATSIGSRVPDVFLPSREQHDHRRQPAHAVPLGVRDRRARREQPALEAVAHRGPALGHELVERAACICARSVVGRDALLGEVRERDQAEPERRPGPSRSASWPPRPPPRAGSAGRRWRSSSPRRR